MATKLRIGTFNCENLFERAGLLNIENQAVAAPLLRDLATLQVELAKTSYDKPAILDLVSDLRPYIEVVATRGQLLDDDWTQVRASGRRSWEGWIALKTDEISDVARSNTAEVIKLLEADILCMVEVENRLVLKEFVDQKLDGRYPHIMLIDGNDFRGIDVGIVSKFPIVTVRSHIDDRDGGERLFSRDCPEVEVHHPQLGSIWLLLNHLKSKRNGGTDADTLRGKQATRIAKILKEQHDLANHNVVVLGDFNDTPNSVPLRPLLDGTNLPDLHDTMTIRPSADRWTYHFGGQGEQIDYILVSKPLKAKLSRVDVERRGIANIDDITGGQTEPLPTVTTKKTAASDHAAVVAELQL